MRFSDLRELQTAANMAGLEMEFLELREAALAVRQLSDGHGYATRLADAIEHERNNAGILLQQTQDQAAEIQRLRAAIEDAAHQLSKARIWGGMDWHYNPLHPMHYRPALDSLREALGPNV